MRIEFCSLCDESVPLPDLDKGIAVKTKGRVICAQCEAAMSTDEIAKAASLDFMGVTPSQGDALQAGGDTTVMDPHGMAPRARPGRRLKSGSLGGMLFAAFSLLMIAGFFAGVHFYDQYELQQEQSAKALRRLGQELRENTRVQDRRVSATVREATQELPATVALVERLQAGLQQLKAGQAAELAGLQREINGVKAKLASVDVLVQRLEGSERSLSQVAAGLADVFDDVLRLERRLDSAEAIAAAAPAVADADAAAPQVAAWLSQVAGLGDPDPGTRWLAVTAIGEFADPACAPHLIPRLGDEDVFVRMAAARILGEVRATSAIEALIDALEDEQNTVRQAAMLALRSLTGESLKFDADDKPAVREKRVKAWRDWWKKNKSKFELL